MYICLHKLFFYMLFNTKNKMDTINRQAAIIRLYYVLLCHLFRKASYRGHIVREGIEANFEHLKISRTLALTFISSCLGAHPDRPPRGLPLGTDGCRCGRGCPCPLGDRSLLATRFQDGCPCRAVQTRAGGLEEPTA